MNVQNAKNLFWSSDDGSRFDCEVQFFGSDLWFPFTCSQSECDVYGHVKELWDRALAGEFGEITPFVQPPKLDSDAPVTATPFSGQIPQVVL